MRHSRYQKGSSQGSWHSRLSPWPRRTAKPIQRILGVCIMKSIADLRKSNYHQQLGERFALHPLHSTRVLR
jgi:hypothetical protein